MKGEKWTTGQIMRGAYLRLVEKMTWPKIKTQMEKEGFPVRSVDNYGATIRRCINQYNISFDDEPKTSDWRNDPATRKQCRYIASMTLPNSNNSEITKLTNELIEASKRGEFDKEAANEQIKLLETALLEAQSFNVKAKNNTNLLYSGVATRWTPKEDALLINWMNEHKDGEQGFPPNLNRTPRACRERWLRSLKHLTPSIKTVRKNGTYTLQDETPTERTLFSHEAPKREMIKRPKNWTRLNNESIDYPNTNKPWTYDESLEALVMWHSMSIDDAREKFGRPYWVIAKHIEKHFDYTYAESKSLLMEAAGIKKQLEANKLAERKPSLRKRWRDKRNAKKQKRLEKKLAKTQRKLEKMELE